MSAFMTSPHLERIHVVTLADAVYDVMELDNLPSHMMARVYHYYPLASR